MLVLITYDVNTETEAGKKRLRKVAKQCINYGQRVQNSVFECILDAAQCRKVKYLLEQIIDPQKDRDVYKRQILLLYQNSKHTVKEGKCVYCA